MNRASAKRRSERSKSTKPNSEERIEFADDEQVVIIRDELAEVEADDPTFAGMRSGARLEEAYPDFIKQLRELHRNRFRHAPPADPIDLFEELAGELLLPGEEELRLYLTRMKANEHFTIDEEEKILKALESFTAREPLFSE